MSRAIGIDEHAAGVNADAQQFAETKIESGKPLEKPVLVVNQTKQQPASPAEWNRDLYTAAEVLLGVVHEMLRRIEDERNPADILDLEDDLRTPAFRLTVQNQGVGPARIAEVAMTVRGQPVANFNSIVDRCCAPGLLQAAQRGTKQKAPSANMANGAFIPNGTAHTGPP